MKEAQRLRVKEERIDNTLFTSVSVAVNKKVVSLAQHKSRRKGRETQPGTVKSDKANIAAGCLLDESVVFMLQLQRLNHNNNFPWKCFNSEDFSSLLFFNKNISL